MCGRGLKQRVKDAEGGNDVDLLHSIAFIIKGNLLRLIHVHEIHLL